MTDIQGYAIPAKNAADVNSKYDGIITLQFSPEHTQRRYNAWAETYEQDMLLKPELLTKCQFMADEVAALVNEKNARILDVCAGTGLGGIALHQLGYTNLDALDGSSGMLQKAKEKQIYNNHICAILGQKTCPVEHASYDAAFCAGGFYVGSLPVQSLADFLCMVKPGGYIAIESGTAATTTYGDVKHQYNANLESAMKTFEDHGYWKSLGVSKRIFSQDFVRRVFKFQVLKNLER